MNQYVVTVKHEPKTSFDKGLTKFRVDAPDENYALLWVKRHSLFPKDGIPIRVRLAAYKKKPIK